MLQFADSSRAVTTAAVRQLVDRATKQSAAVSTEDDGALASASTSTMGTQTSASSSTITWSHWQTLRKETYLVVGYANGTMQVWLHPGRGAEMREVIRFNPQEILDGAASTSKQQRIKSAQIEAALLVERRGSPSSGERDAEKEGGAGVSCIALVSSADTSTSAAQMMLQLAEIRCDTGRVLRIVPVAPAGFSTGENGHGIGQGRVYATMRASARFVVVSVSCLPAVGTGAGEESIAAGGQGQGAGVGDSTGHAFIGVHSAADLRPLDVFSDTAQPFADRSPAFDLSGRLLAYATTVTDGSGAGAALAAAAATGGGAGTSSPFSTTMQQQQQPHHASQSQAQMLDTARLVGSHVYAGARTLGSLGAGYLSQSLGTTLPLGKRAFGATVTSGNSGDGSAIAPPTTADVTSPGAAASPPTRPTVIRIVDLARGRRVVANVPPMAAPVAALRFNPSGELLFAADTLGHTFYVFAVQSVGCAVGGSGGAAASCKLMYKVSYERVDAKAFECVLTRDVFALLQLHRGLSTAQVASVEWSGDSHFVFTTTRRGTTHVAAIRPSGGKPHPKECLAGVVHGLPSSRTHALTIPIHLATWVADPQTTPAAMPSPAWQCSTLIAEQPGAMARSACLLVFHPDAGAIVQTQCLLTVRETGATAHNASSTAGSSNKTTSSRRAAAAAFATSTSTEPTQMMLRAAPGSDAPTHIWRGVRSDTTAEGCLLAAWPSSSARNVGSRRHRSQSHHSWVAGAEIETNAQIHRAHATHLYICPQAAFVAYAPSASALGVDCEAHLSATTPVETRTRVEVRKVDDPNERLDTGVRAAMSQGAFGAGSKSLPTIPSFPQGRAARSPSWTHQVSQGIPIRSVTGGISRARFGLVRSMDAVRRISGPTAMTTSASSARREPGTALSFDDVEYKDSSFAEARSSVEAHSESPAMGSNETPLTAISSRDGEADDDFDKDAELAWDLARGTAEDVEGDEMGWDAFGDREFGGRGMRPPSDKSEQRPEEFLVGVFDEEADGHSGFSEPSEVSSHSSRQSTKTKKTKRGHSKKALGE